MAETWEWADLAGRLRPPLEELANRLAIAGVDPSLVPAADVGGALRALAAQIESAGSPPDLAAFASSMLAVQTEWSPTTVETLAAGVRRLREMLENPRPASRPPAELAVDPELVADFLLESREHLGRIETNLLRLEQNPEDQDAIHTVFRGFHTIKGLAGFLDFGPLQTTAHEVETLLDRARNGQLRVGSRFVDAVLAGKDYLEAMLARIENAPSGTPPELPLDEGLIGRVRRLVAGGGEESAPLPPSRTGTARPPTPGKDADCPAAGKQDASRESRTVKVDTGKLDFLVDMVGEMVIAQSLVRHDPDLAALQRPQLIRNLSQLARITGEVQKAAMAMRMVPIAQLFRKVSRLVRDLSHKSGKAVSLATSGEDTELDRNIVEELSDPLVHMVRNAIDHGIEPPGERAAAGKPPQGRIELTARHQSGCVVVEIGDDGRGLDRERILAKARRLGLAADSETPPESELFNLIFQPGFSTAEKVTDVSGRGVGMDVVRKQILKLRGRVDISSTPGVGTLFSLKLPLTLAIIDGLIIRVGEQRLISPLSVVREVLRPKAEMVFTIEGRHEIALIRGRLVPVIRLYERFGFQPASTRPEEGVLVLLESEGRAYALLVDELLGKQEVVIKSLGETLKRIPGVAGGAILGDGRVGLVLDADSLMGGEVGGR